MRVLTVVALLVIPLASNAGVLERYTITLNAMAAPSVNELRKFYLVPDPNLNAGGLEHQRIARQVSAAMEMAGFREVTEPADAEIALYVNYAISGPRTTYSQLPNGMGSTDTEYTRQLLLIAANAQNFLESGEAVEVWRASMMSMGSTATLSDVIPAMLAKSYEYFGTNLRRPQTLHVNGANSTVTMLRDL